MRALLSILWVILCSFFIPTAYAAQGEVVLGSFDPGTTIQNQTTHVSSALASQTIDSLFHNSGDPVSGNPSGSITLVEFFDYQCSHCQAMVTTMARIAKANPNLRIVYKEFPIRGSLSVFAAKAALAANKQGKYFPFHEALMRLTSDLSEDSVLAAASKLGINTTQLTTDMNNSSIAHQIDNTESLATTLQLTGTPSFFIGKTNGSSIDFINGEVSESYLQDAIKNVARGIV